MKIIEVSATGAAGQTSTVGPTGTAEFDRFVEDHPLGNIQQCWNWGVFQGKSGQRDRFYALAVENEKMTAARDARAQASPSAKAPAARKIVASALLVRQKLPFGKSWLYCPRGPVADYSNPTILALLFKKIAEIAKRENAVFLRFEPPIETAALARAQNPFKNLHTRPAHAHYQPESTLIVDLRHDPDRILAQMKQKGRYNIKVAQKHGVAIRVSDGNENDVTAFYDLLRQTTARDRFSPHPKSYYQDMLAELGQQHAKHDKHAPHPHVAPSAQSTPPPHAKLYLAEFQGKTVAGLIATYFKDTATYYFGASGNEHRNVMAPYLLHWRVMEDARAAGYHYYDFFGISPEIAQTATNLKRRSHPWASVTEFKLKFGGQRVDYYPAQEIVYLPFWYFLMRLAKWMLKIVKR